MTFDACRANHLDSYLGIDTLRGFAGLAFASHSELAHGARLSLRSYTARRAEWLARIAVRSGRGWLGTDSFASTCRASRARGRRLEIDGRGGSISRLEALSFCSRGQHFCFGNYGDHSGVSRWPRNGNASQYVDLGKGLLRLWLEEEPTDFAR